ncbi:MAG: PAS domain S-box protein [Chloroflexota bacterium]
MNAKDLNILLIEDNPGDARLIREMLADAGPARFRLACADRLSTGLERLAQGGVEAVLLDLGLPDSQGLDTLRRVVAELPLAPTIVVLTGLDDEELGLRAIEAGAQDYLVKGQVDANLLSRALRYAVERKRARDRLCQSEERYRSTLENMLEGCQIVGFDWCYLYVNEATTKHARQAKETLLGHTMMEVYPGIEDTEMFAFLRRCMEQRTPHHMENEFVYPDGSQGWFELSIQPVPEGVFVLSIDISKRKQAEEALRDSEERFRQVYEHMAVGMARVSLDFRIEAANEAYCRMLGYTEEELVGKYLRDITHPEIVAENLRQQAQLVSGEIDHYCMEKQFIHKDGRVVHGILDASLVRDARGNPGYCLGSVLDITERKQAEQALRESERLLREIAANYPNSYVSVIERDLTVGFTSGQEFKKQGLDPESFVGLPLEQVFGEHTPLVREHYLKAFDGVETEFELFINDQYQYYQVIPLVDDRGRVERILAVVENITERKRAEEELREYRERLEELVKERTADLKKLVNAMAGREVRMAELKDVIRQLRAQLEKAGLTPAANDPLLAGDS